MASFQAKEGSLRKIQIDTKCFCSVGLATNGIQPFQPPVNRTLLISHIEKIGPFGLLSGIHFRVENGDDAVPGDNDLVR